MTLALLMAALCAFTPSSLAQAQTKPAADLIVTNAKIWTVDKTRPHAEALAVLGNHIVAVGSAAEVDT
ncbi:MAG TPA: amidohydrolase, partial [Candidatus Angelobacter sp.]|nr:amidohydrolase [Candidatus Angelobacter sp.]